MPRPGLLEEEMMGNILGRKMICDLEMQVRQETYIEDGEDKRFRVGTG
jgi:hypothetical protein